MPAFHGLDKALRWLRIQNRRKQREVAEAAGITQAMLCSYEQGKRQPSLRTLEKILDTLEVDLPRLFEVLQVVRHNPMLAEVPPPHEGRSEGEPAGPPPRPETGSAAPDPSSSLYRALGTSQRLPADQEEALGLMLEGFVSWLRSLHRAATIPPPRPGADPPTDTR